ncbi:MAG: tRNA guanosine(34) transglycosylase Tgt [Planctomycetes bacterium]|nr:tRNA guanosine(34) transglycosylase Tgt [Planctomycetota bacterium]
MSIFEITTKDSGSSARCGLLETAGGTVTTPVFMPVGTRGSVKGLLPETIKQTGSQIVLANTYHLLIRPGVDAVEKLGGLHKLMAWDGPILTDSGGYQVFSLSTLNRVGDDGVEFASHVDGSKIYMDAKIATEVQNRLGADIIMCFDECAPYPCEAADLRKAVDRTIRWAGQCKEAHGNDKQLLFGIVQGGVDLELRKECAEKLIEMDFDGYAIGGLSVGEGHENMITVADFTAPLLPENKPRYLMGVGMPADIIAAVRAGVDMFDCVLPTRNGRNGFAFTDNGPLKMRNSKNSEDRRAVDEKCDCYCCKNFSRGAIRHFFNVGEMLGPILISIHNITFYQKLMHTIREKIENNTFSEWAAEMIAGDKYNTVK